MKNYFFIPIFMFFIGCSVNEKRQNQDSLERIPIDIRNEIREFDFSSLIDTNYVEIIPLETNDECLIAEIKNIYIFNNKIVIYDVKAKGAYIFNRDGSYRAKVRAIGQGPGEYTEFINDIYASENFIAVLARPGIMLYDYSGKYVKTISRENRWGRNIFTFNEINYFLVNDWSMTSNLQKNEYYHLYQFYPTQNKIQSYLPFSQSDLNNNRGWGLQKYYSQFENKALIYFGSIDTLYSITQDNEVSPRYYIDIVYKKMPKELRIGDGKIAMRNSIDTYEMGVTNVTETSRYLFLKLIRGKTVIYDKKEKKTVAISNIFRISPMFALSFIDFSFGSDYIVYHIPGYYAYNAKKEIKEEKAKKIWPLGDGTTAFERKFLKFLENDIDEEDNPVLFIFKVKQ